MKKIIFFLFLFLFLPLSMVSAATVDSLLQDPTVKGLIAYHKTYGSPYKKLLVFKQSMDGIKFYRTNGGSVYTLYSNTPMTTESYVTSDNGLTWNFQSSDVSRTSFDMFNTINYSTFDVFSDNTYASVVFTANKTVYTPPIDSDGDGLTDDVDPYPADPLNNDSDSDGLENNVDPYPDDPTNTPPPDPIVAFEGISSTSILSNAVIFSGMFENAVLVLVGLAVAITVAFSIKNMF